MSIKLTGLAFIATLLAPASSSALLDSEGESPKTLFVDSCEFHDYTLKLRCDVLKYEKGEPICEIIETKNGDGKVVPFPSNLNYPIVGVEIYPFQNVRYCRDPDPKDKNDGKTGSELIS